MRVRVYRIVTSMARPNYIEISYYPIDDRKRRGLKTTMCVPNAHSLSPREIARRALAGLPGKPFLIEARPIYRSHRTIEPPMSAADLTAWRDRLGLSTRDAAYALALTQRAIQYYESGVRPVPGPVAKLAMWIERENLNRV
jgi:DNA-binding transcriptional regulator YiaG